MNNKILVVDDDVRIRKLVKDFLKREDYIVLEAGDGAGALDIFNKNKDISLIILDVMMPFMDGWDTCIEIRKISSVPIIMATAKASEEDQLKGYDLEIDDYVIKPFSPKILVAKVNAILKRVSDEKDTGILIEGILEVNTLSHVAKVNGNELDLSFKEFELLRYLMKNKKLALSREQILSDVWDYDYFGDARTVDTHIKKLRAKLGDAGDYIKTIRGLGYKFEV